MPSPPKLLYEDDHVQLLYQNGPSSFTLATFSNYGFKADGATLWGQRLIERENIETYGFVAKANNWFPKDAMASLLQSGVFRPSKPVVTYGHSQGGYAALKYSASLGATGVVACAPQFSINPASVPKDRRFSHHFSESLHQDMDIEASDIAGNVVVVYDPYDCEDAYEVNRILERYIGSTMKQLWITNIGHSIMEVLRDRDLLLSVFDASLCASQLLSVFNSARKLKKSSHSYGYCLAARVLDHNRPRLTLAILDIVLRNAGSFTHSAPAARYAELRSKAYVAMRMIPEALHQSEMAMRLQPQNPRFVAWHEQCLLAKLC
jgi:hypothetical protein